MWSAGTTRRHPEVVAARAAQPGRGPGVLDLHVVRAEQGHPQLGSVAALHAVAVEHSRRARSRWRSPTGRSPGTRRRPGAIEPDGAKTPATMTSGPVEDLVERGAGQGRRGRSTRRRRSSPSRPWRRRPGPGPRGPAIAREVGAEAAVALAAAASGSTRRRAARRAGRRGSRRAASISAARAAIVGASSRAVRTAGHVVGGGSTVVMSRPVTVQHRGLDGVPGPQLRVPAAVAVADDLGDAPVAHLAEPQPPGAPSPRAGLLVLHDEAGRGRHDAQQPGADLARRRSPAAARRRPPGP